MEVACGEHGECVHKLVMAVNNGKCNNYQHYQAGIAAAQTVSNDIAKESPQEQTKPEGAALIPNGVAKPGVTMINMPVSCTTSLLDSAESIEQKVGFPTNGWVQFWILLKRTFLSQIRDMVMKYFFLNFFEREKSFFVIKLKMLLLLRENYENSCTSRQIEVAQFLRRKMVHYL